MGWKELRSGGAPSNRSGGARSNRRPKDLLAGNSVDPHGHNEQITKESDIVRRFYSLEEKGSLKCTGHSAVKDIETDAQTCHGSISSAATLEEHKKHFGDASERENMPNRGANPNTRPNDLLAGSRAGSRNHNDIYSKEITKESDIGKRFKSLEENGSSKCAGHFAVKDIDVDRQTCDRTPKDLLAGNRVDPHGHSEQITKESDIVRRFYSLEEKGSSKCTGHSAVKDIETDAQTCHGSISSAATLEEHKKHFGDASERENMPNRGANPNTRCRCVDAALNRRYFDQPFACIYCHGSAIQSLIDYIEWNPITEAFVPPGDAYGAVFVDTGINIRVILRCSTASLHRVHLANKSFAGNFELSDLYLDNRKCVRFDSRKAICLTECTRENIEADYAKLGLILSRDLFHGQVMPSDIRKWIGLMEDDPSTGEYLIVHNICLMESRQSVNHFGSLYAHLEVLRKERSRIYWLIINELTARHPDWWKEDVLQNFYVEDTYDYKDRETGARAHYEHDSRGLLRLAWNLSKHVLPKSVVFILAPVARKGEKFKRLVAARKFTDRMIESILKSSFIGLMVDLQELMHKYGQLTRFYLEEWMGKT